MTEKKGGFLKAVKEFIYGMAAHDSVDEKIGRAHV